MKYIMKYIIAIIFLASLSGCDERQPTSSQVKMAQSQKAESAANSIVFDENAEIDNIKKRLELTADPGLLGYVVLLNEMGQPVMYIGVKGKITSGGKRLTKPYDWVHKDCGQAYCDKEVDAPSDEGTYGHSGEYVYFWTTNGQYIQWNGKYLYSDQPFRLTKEPLVLSIDDKKGIK